MSNPTELTFENIDYSLVTTLPPTPAKVPEGTADEILYRYNISGDPKNLKNEFFRFRTPEFTSDKNGIIPATANQGPVIKVNFDMSDRNQRKFVGDFGNQYEYHEDDDGILNRVQEIFTPASGCLGKIWEFSVESYANYEKDKKKLPKCTPRIYQRATDMVTKRNIVFIPHDENGNVIPGKNPSKYFKLRNYHPGQPDENICKFNLSNGIPILAEILHGRQFVFSAILYVQRIFIGKQTSVQMQFTSIIVFQIMEKVTSYLSTGDRELCQKEQEENPERAAKLIDQMKRIEQEMGSKRIEDGVTKVIDILAIDGINESGITVTEVESSTRPSLPSRTRKDYATDSDE